MAIEEGKKAPQFTLEDENGNQVALKNLSGKHVILFFYPRDNTPGCTKEACGFRDLYGDIKNAGVELYGISADSAKSHQKFINDHQLPFPLLVDSDRKVMEKYEAYGEKVMYGRRTMGVIRSTVWIGPNGKVVKHWRRVPKAADHPAKVLEAISAEVS